MSELGTTELARLEKSIYAMGAVFSIVLYGQDPPEMEAALHEAFAEAHRLEEILSKYRPESEWSEINRNAEKHAVKVSRELFLLLYDCMEYSRESDGAFDVSVGPLLKAWGFVRGGGRMPDEVEVNAARAAVGHNYVRLDSVTQTVQFERRGMEIDPGGIGKGYAVDRMVAVLKRRGFDTALVAGSGSSIYGLGSPPHESRGWPVDIADPLLPKRSLAEVFLKDSSLSTSGISRQFFWQDGRSYSHILDPRTGYPAQGTILVSVIAPRTQDSEAWTKVFFVNGYNWAENHKGEFRVFFCRDTAERSCTWL